MPGHSDKLYRNLVIVGAEDERMIDFLTIYNDGCVY